MKPPEVVPVPAVATDRLVGQSTEKAAIATGSVLSEILVVDDSTVQRTVMSHMLRNCGYQVVEAADGEEAFRIVRERKIRLVFTDWMMPRMTGIELIQKIRTADLGFYVYVIVCSCKDSKTEVIEGIRAGANDFLIKPAHQDQLLARLHAGAHVIDLETRIALEEEELKHAYAALSKAHERLSSDLQAAAKLQLSLLPRPCCFRSVCFDWIFRPASQVAGDIFNVFLLDQEHVAFYELDVSGHGVPAAMFSFSLSKSLYANPLRDSILKRVISEHPFYRIVPPNEVAAELNVTFQNEDDMYFTMIYGILNMNTGHLQFVQAGHPNPVLVSANGSIRALGGTGFPVAAVPAAEFELTEEFLKPGDRLILCSDGVTECLNPEKEQFGGKRLTGSLEEIAGQPLSDVTGHVGARLVDWRGQGEFDDDISMLVLEYTGTEGHSTVRAVSDRTL